MYRAPTVKSYERAREKLAQKPAKGRVLGSAGVRFRASAAPDPNTDRLNTAPTRVHQRIKRLVPDFTAFDAARAQDRFADIARLLERANRAHVVCERQRKKPQQVT